MKEHMADWRIHALAFVLTVIAEFIGTKKFSFGPLSFSLFPMLYVLILGAILGIAKMIPQKMMTEASPYIGISVMMLTAKIAQYRYCDQCGRRICFEDKKNGHPA